MRILDYIFTRYPKMKRCLVENFEKLKGINLRIFYHSESEDLRKIVFVY